MSNNDKNDKMSTKDGKPGPKAEVLIIDGNWKDAVAHALAKGKPPAPAKKSKKKVGAKKKRT